MVAPPLWGEAMWEAGMEEVEVYITWIHIVSAHYIVTRLNMELCDDPERRLVSWVSQRW